MLICNYACIFFFLHISAREQHLLIIMAEDSDEDFEEQLRMEARAKQLEEDSGQSTGEKLEQGRTKVDPDGTVYEWDAAKKAWFPKVPISALSLPFPFDSFTLFLKKYIPLLVHAFHPTG